MGSSESWAWKRHRSDVWRLRGKHGLNPGVLESGTVQRCQESQIVCAVSEVLGLMLGVCSPPFFSFFP